MAKKKIAKKKTVKNVTKKKSDTQWFGIFTMNATKKGGYVLNGNFHEKYGVAAIAITTHDGEVIELDEDTPIFAKENEDYGFFSCSLPIEA